MRLTLRTLTILAAVFFGREAAAQETSNEPAREEQGGSERELGKHRFVIPSEIDNAFMVTSLAFDQGFGVMTVRTPDIEGKLFLLRERLRLQLGLANRVAFEVSADANAGVAGNADTLLALAGIANLEFAFGPKVRLFSLPELGLQVSAGLSYRPTLTYSVSPIALAGDTDQVLSKENPSYVEPGLLVALGQRAIGVQLEARPAITTDSNKKPSQFRGGAAASLDFSGPTGGDVPFAIALEYNLEKDFDGSVAEHYLTSGLFFSAKRDLQLGLRYSKVIGMPNTRLQFGTLNLGYFF